MMPHTADSLKKCGKPGATGFPPSETSAELSSNELSDRIRETARFCLRRSFRKQPDNGFGPRSTDEHARRSVQLLVQTLDLVDKAFRQRPAWQGKVLLDLWERRHHCRGGGERAAANRIAQKQRRSEPIAGDVVAQVDDVTGLLAAEQTVVLAERLEDVAIADGRRDDANVVLLEQPVEREVRQDVIAVDGLAVLIDSEHSITVAVERDSEVERVIHDRLLKRA